MKIFKKPHSPKLIQRYKQITHSYYPHSLIPKIAFSKFQKEKLQQLTSSELRGYYNIRPRYDAWGIFQHIPIKYNRIYDPKATIFAESRLDKKDAILWYQKRINAEKKHLKSLKCHFLVKTWRPATYKFYFHQNASQETIEKLKKMKPLNKIKRFQIDRNFSFLSYLTYEPKVSFYVKSITPALIPFWSYIPQWNEGFWIYVAKEFEWPQSIVYSLNALIIYLIAISIAIPISLIYLELFFINYIKFIELDDIKLKKSFNWLTDEEIVVACGERGIMTSLYTPQLNKELLFAWLNHSGSFQEKVIARIIKMEEEELKNQISKTK